MDDALLKDAATAIVGDLIPELAADEAEPEAPSVPEVAAAETDPVQPEAEAPAPFDLSSLNPELPAEYSEPDFEEEAELELSAISGEITDDTGLEQYEDEQLREERKKRIAAEKRAAFLEAQRTKDNQGKWRAEATKYAPLAEAFLDEITATSRRGFIREARKIHDKLYPLVVKVAEERAAEAKAEARAEAEAAWGKPTSGAGGAPNNAVEAARNVETARKTGKFSDVVKARLNAGFPI